MADGRCTHLPPSCAQAQRKSLPQAAVAAGTLAADGRRAVATSIHIYTRSKGLIMLKCPLIVIEQ